MLIRILISLFALVLLITGLAWLRPASTPAIEGTHAIAELTTATIGGIPQWLLLRGRDSRKPVVLFLHGGPGVPNMSTWPIQSDALESHFVVAHWDQRGAGKSCATNDDPSRLTLERMVLDVTEVTEWLRARFSQEKIHLVGHSWGSVVGVLAVKRAPELFHAYVGVGQVVDMRRGEALSTAWTMERARAEGNERALEELRALEFPYATVDELMRQRRWLGHYGGDRRGGGALFLLGRVLATSSEYTLREKLTTYGCAIDSLEHLWFAFDDLDFIRDMPSLEVPVHLFIGRHDYNTPFSLAEEWATRLRAPSVETVWFESSAHMPNLEEPERFQRELIARLR